MSLIVSQNYFLFFIYIFFFKNLISNFNDYLISGKRISPHLDYFQTWKFWSVEEYGIQKLHFEFFLGHKELHLTWDGCQSQDDL